MPVKLFTGHFGPKDCKAKPEALFVFGDNMNRRGTGGQACIRFEPNAVGLATKHLPTTAPDAYFSNQDIDLFREEVRRVHYLIKPHLKSGRTVYFPAGGLGSGLARMPQKAPLLYSGLCKYLRGLFDLECREPLSTVGIWHGSSTTGQSEICRLSENAQAEGRRLEVLTSKAPIPEELQDPETLYSHAPAFRNPGDSRTIDHLLSELRARRDQFGNQCSILVHEDAPLKDEVVRRAERDGLRILGTPSHEDAPSPVA